MGEPPCDVVVGGGGVQSAPWERGGGALGARLQRLLLLVALPWAVLTAVLPGFGRYVTLPLETGSVSPSVFLDPPSSGFITSLSFVMCYPPHTHLYLISSSPFLPERHFQVSVI